MNELELLKEYITSSEPRLNYELRSGENCEDAVIFDRLFSVGEVPTTLYRFLPDKNMQISEDNIFCDSAYLSCTSDIDKYWGRTNGEKLTCIMIKTHSPMSRVDINSFLPNQNDEGEYILPRNSRLRITKHQCFEGIHGFEKFIDIVGSFENANTLSDIYHYHKIDLYTAEIIQI